jgi:hypothetical protein
VMKVDSIFQLPSHSWLDMGLNVSEFLPDHRWPNENDLHEFELDVSSCPTHRWNMSLMGSPSHGSFHCHSEGRTFFFFFFFCPSIKSHDFRQKEEMHLRTDESPRTVWDSGRSASYPLKPPLSSSLTLKGPRCRSAGFGSGTGHETRDPPTYAPSVAVCLTN